MVRDESRLAKKGLSALSSVSGQARRGGSVTPFDEFRCFLFNDRHTPHAQLGRIEPSQLACGRDAGLM
jgi:hypothetical protein